MKWLASPLFLVAFVGIAWGCGGGRELSLEEYFYRLEVVIDDDLARTEEVYRQSNEEPGDDIEALRDYWDSLLAIQKGTANDLQELNPPAEAQAAHDEFVAALNALRETYEAYRDLLADAESIEEAEASVPPDMPDLDSLMHRHSDACFALADIASENNIDVYLQCPSVD